MTLLDEQLGVTESVWSLPLVQSSHPACRASHVGGCWDAQCLRRRKHSRRHWGVSDMHGGGRISRASLQTHSQV